MQEQSANSSRTYKIGELALLLNDTTRTLRYYEELGLLEPLRTDSGQRVYSEAAIQRLRLIHELKAGGFSLNHIRDLFQAWNGQKTGGDASQVSLRLLETKIAEISELKSRLSRLQEDLESMVRYVADCRPCEHKPSLESCGQCSRHHGMNENHLVTLLKRG